MESLPIASSSVSGKSPSGPTKTAAGVVAVKPSERLGHRLAPAALVAQDEAPVGWPVGEQAGKRHLRADLGERMRSLCSGRQRRSPQPLAIDAFRLRPRGHHRDQRGRPKLGRFFDEPVEAGALDRRENEPDIRAEFRRAPLLDRLKRTETSPQRVDAAQKLAVALIKGRDRRAGREAHTLRSRCTFSSVSGTKARRLAAPEYRGARRGARKGTKSLFSQLSGGWTWSDRG